MSLTQTFTFWSTLCMIILSYFLFETFMSENDEDDE
jgi:hypothetical protein